ncbi:MAG: hypothetical protein JJT78_15800 [Leptospira sp.]|nr:hypothetical protein [Leptospira sp.]
MNDLDPNSSLGQLLNLLRIQSALQPREIRITGSAINLNKSNEPFYNIFATARKMPESYFTDYSEGAIETTEGEFTGTFLSDGSGEIEIVLESGLGKYRFDFYENANDGLILRHSELLNFQSFDQPLNNTIISRSSGNAMLFTWNKLNISTRNSYSFYNLSLEGVVKFLGEKNGRAFYFGQLLYPKNLEFRTNPDFQIINLSYNIYLAYTDDGTNWNSLVLKEYPVSFPFNLIFFRGSYFTENEMIFIFTEETQPDSIKIHKYTIPFQNPNSYTLSSSTYVSTISDFDNLGIYNDQKYLYAGGLIYEERNSGNEPTYFITFDFFETPGIQLNNANTDSPFETSISSTGNVGIHNGSFGRIIHISGDQGSIKFMNPELNQFNGFGYSLLDTPLGGNINCRLNSISIYCMEANAIPDLGRFSVKIESLPFNESSDIGIPNGSGISFPINGSINFRGEVSIEDFSLISYNTSVSFPSISTDHLFRVRHSNSIVDVIPQPDRFLADDFMIQKEFTIENGMGTRSGEFLQLTREINYFLDGGNSRPQRQPYLTSSRSADGSNWSTPVKVDIKPPRLNP